MKKLISMVVLASLMFTVSACSNQEAEEGAETEKDTLILGTSADYPPYEFKKNIDGEDQYVGLDIEFAKEVAKKAGKELEIVDMPFKSLLLELEIGKIDFVASGLAYSDERAEKYDLSSPYYNVKQVVVTLKDNVDTYNSIESMIGKSVGVQTGTIQEQIANREMDESKVISMDKVPNIIMEVKTGKIEGIILEEPVAEVFISQHEDLAISFEVVDHTNGTKIMAVKQGNTELLEVINETITEVTDSGLFDEFMEDAVALASEE